MVKLTMENGVTIEGTVEEIKELSKAFGVEADEQKPAKFKVGDYARVIRQPDHYQNGTIVKIVGTNYDEQWPFDTENLDGTVGDCHSADELEKVTDEEVAKALGEKKSVKVGDHVKAVKCLTYGEPRVGWGLEGQGLMKVGAVGEVVEIDGKGVYVKFDDRQPGVSAGKESRQRFYLRNGEYEVISARESSEIKAEQAEVEKWRAIGRKPNEFKEGDIIRVLDPGTSNLREGEVGILGEHNGRGSFRVFGRLKFSNWVGGPGEGGSFELLSPVEKRFN